MVTVRHRDARTTRICASVKPNPRLIDALRKAFGFQASNSFRVSAERANLKGLVIGPEADARCQAEAIRPQ
jgi:hypothetical protein